MSWNLWRDLRYAAHRLLASPGFTAAATLTIALGIGLNAGAFSILNGILFSGLPVPQADQLVDIYEVVEGLPGRNEKGRVNRQFTTSEYRTLSDRTETLSGVIGYSVNWPVLLRRDGSRQITGRYVTCNYFDVFRQPAALGRGLLSGDCDRGAQPVVMLSHELWMTVFGSDPSIVGRSITLNTASVTVVGIANEAAYQPSLQKLDFFAPITTQPLLRPDRQWLASEEFGWLTLVGRRAAERGIDEVRAELNVVAAQIDLQQPGRSTRVFVDPARPPTNQPGNEGEFAASILFVFVPCGLILLAACANIANLFLARAADRAPEVALRVSLGASRARVLQQFFAESLLVSMVACVLGLILFASAFEGLATYFLSGLRIALPDLQLDVRVLLFAVVLSLGTGVITGLVPALSAGRANLYSMAGRSSSSSGVPSRSRLQSTFIGAQAAICMTFLIVTAMLLRFLYEANTVDPGFPYRDITVVSGDLRDFGYVDTDLVALQRQLEDEVRGIAGVEAVGYITNPPWDRRATYGRLSARAAGDTEFHQFALTFVGPDYLDALGIPIVRGRAFNDDDFSDSSSAVIVNETTARQLWPGRDPIGQTMTPRGSDADQQQSWRVVGVARDTQTTFGQLHEKHIFATSQPALPHMLSLIVRSPRAFTSLAPDIRSAITRLDPDLSLSVLPLEDSLVEYRYVSALTSGVAVALGGLALALASVGIYGVVAYVVGRQRREIGIRLALGAPARNVLAAILRRTMRPVAIGAVLGCAGAATAAVIIQNTNAGVRLSDPIAVIFAIVVVVGVSLAASVMPARQGLRIDPMATLRSE